MKRFSLTFTLVMLMIASLVLIAQDTKDIIKTTSDGEEELRMERLAVVIGVGDYLSNQVSDLKYTVSDAEKMADVLTDYGIFDVHLYINDSEMKPTKDNIESALEDSNYLASRSMIKSFVLYFSGHGFQQDDVNYLAPMEINPENPELTGINLNEVLELIDSIQENAKVMVFMDACRNDPSGSKGFGKGFAQDDESHGYGIFYSTSPGDFSWEVEELKGGLYTYYLLKALKGGADASPLGNEDGYVSFSEATAYVTYSLRQWSKDNPKMKQLPWESTSKTGEFFITKVGDTTKDITSNIGGNIDIEPTAYELKRSIFGHSNWVNSVCFSPNGKLLASGSQDDTAIIWDVSSGELIYSLEGHSGDVTSVSFSPDGERLATGSKDDTIRIWDVSSGELVKTLKAHSEDVTSVSFNPDGTQIASASWDTTIIVWDIKTGKSIRTLKGHTSYILSVSFSPDGKLLASGSGDQMIKIWDAESGEVVHNIEGDSYGVKGLSFSPDGELLASCGNSRAIRIWNVKSGRLHQMMSGDAFGVLTICYSPDGKYVATGSHDKLINIWEVSTGKVLATLSGHNHWVNSLSFSPDSRLIASGSSDETIKVWGVE